MKEKKENIIFATRNPSKIEQVRVLFKDSPFTIQSLSETKIKGQAIEDGATLQENALKKAKFAFEWANHDTFTMADDTGLFIDILDGEPGIKSARWGGEGLATEQIMNHCLIQLGGMPYPKRTATFETIVTIITHQGDEHFFSGKVRGHLLETPRTKRQPGMPYSSLFVPDGTDLVWAEMSTEEENQISHRGIAFRKARVFLEEFIRSC
jgi:XTP/dITP diphosphohydrolase